MKRLLALLLLGSTQLVGAAPAGAHSAPVHECDRLAASASDPDRLAEGIDTGRIDVPSAVAACEVAVRSYPDEPRFAFQLARAYSVSPTPERAAAHFRELSQEGHALSMTSLGVMLMQGHGVLRDDAEGARLFRRAAEFGEPVAMINLATAYEHGRGVEQDADEVAYWQQRAVGARQVQTMIRLGRLHVDSNPAEAARWYRKAAELGEPRAMYALAALLGQGPDVEEAAEWFMRALETGGVPLVQAIRKDTGLWAPQMVIRLQQQLSEAKVYSGQDDGSVSPELIAAMEAYAGQH
ncbi:MAG TPA: tetratricopeptide repeat protein [Afifellaceae bacterium]|nr:tetratricopeptide repeat protein [Afifellaceae bacterium]